MLISQFRTGKRTLPKLKLQTSVICGKEEILSSISGECNSKRKATITTFVLKKTGYFFIIIFYFIFIMIGFVLIIPFLFILVIYTITSRLLGIIWLSQ